MNAAPLEPPSEAGQAKLPRRKVAGLALALLLAAGAFYLALRQVSWQETRDTLRGARLELIALSLGLSTLSLIGRSLRWGVLVGAQAPARPLDLFFATAIGYMGNNLLPARAGEVLRSLALGKAARVSASFVLATALSERVLDALALVAIGAAALPAAGVSLPEWLPGAMWAVALAGAAALTAFAFAPRFEAWLQRPLARLPLPPAWRERLAGLLSQFLLGAKAFADPGRAGRFLALTALIWLLDGLGAVIFARGLGLALNLGQALLLLAALGLASALPSTPGYLGIYQLVAVSLMPAFGISPSQALAYILANQALNVMLVVAWGVIGLGRWRWGKEG